MIRRVALVLLLFLLGAQLLLGAEEGIAEPTYAGRPASWWVRELGSARTEAVAREALRVLGAPAFPHLVAGLVDENPAVRSAVAMIAPEFPGDPLGSLPALEEAVRHPHAHACLAGMRIARRAGPPARTILPALLARTEDPDAVVRREALLAVVSVAPESKETIPVLRAALRSDDRVNWQIAVHTLGKMGPAAGEVAPDLAHAFRRSDDANASLLLRAIGQVRGRGPDVRDVLRASLTHRSSYVRTAAPWALAACASADPEVLAMFLEVFEDRDPEQRVRAVQAAGDETEVTPAAIPALLRVMADSDPRVRAAAVESLARLGTRLAPEIPRLIQLHVTLPSPEAAVIERSGLSAGPWLAQAYPTADPATRTAFAAMLLRVPASTLVREAPGLIAALGADVASQNTKPDVRGSIVQLLAALAAEDPTAVTPLLALLRDDDAPTPVFDVLRNLPSARVPLLDMLTSPEPRARRRALDVLLKANLTPDERMLVGRLLADPEPDLRQRAALAMMRAFSAPERRRPGNRFVPQLAPVDPALLVPILMEACTSSDAQVRWDAVRCLGVLDTFAKDALETVVRALGDPDREVVGHAATSAVRIAKAHEISLHVALRPLLEGEDRYARAGAALALAQAGPEHVRATLDLTTTLLDEPDDRTRFAALDVVIALKSDAGSLLARVLALTNDPVPAVAAKARVALEAIRVQPAK